MSDPTITPDTVRALLEAATPGPWRGDRYDGTVKYRILAGSEDEPITVLLVDHKNGTYGFGCYDGGPNAEHPDADEALVLAAPTIAAAYLAVCEERDRLARVIDNPGDIDMTFSTTGLDKMHLAHAETVKVTITSYMVRDHLRARLDADRAGGSDV